MSSGGVPKNYQEAVKWYRAASEQRNVNATTNLGVMYENGRGVPKDEKAAARLYQKAAVWGDQRARLYLGLLFLDGRGVPQNDSPARIRLEEASLGPDKRIAKAARRGLGRLGSARSGSGEISAGEIFVGLLILAAIFGEDSSSNSGNNSQSPSLAPKPQKYVPYDVCSGLAATLPACGG